MERKLATIEVIEDLWNHPNADLLDLARVRGWQCVVKKGEFAKGDKVIYFEIDSFIPTELAPFLSKDKEPRVFEGIKGERLKTIRLRGELSQGLILPISILGSVDFPLEDGTDVSKHLGVIKWELPLPAQLQGQVEGNFPSWIPKTDQERCIEANTSIITDDGIKTIKEIVDSKFSGKVLSYDSLIDDDVWHKVIGWSEMPSQPNEWVKITTLSGNFIIVTKNHKVYLPSIDAYRKACFLNCGNCLQTDTITFDEIISIEPFYSESSRYDITVENTHNFYANGILVHNCQNCYSEMAYLDNYEHGGIDWNVEEKADGASCSVFVRFNSDVATGYETGICSRNFQLKINEENKDNTYIKTITNAGYLEHLHKVGFSIAIQGEICGPGIQGNKYKLETPSFFVFDIYFIAERRYATFDERMNILKYLFDLGVRVNQVPYLGVSKLPKSVQNCLTLAEGKSQLNSNTEREGLVFKTGHLVEGKMYSFKIVSNAFLLKEKD